MNAVLSGEKCRQIIKLRKAHFGWPETWKLSSREHEPIVEEEGWLTGVKHITEHVLAESMHIPRCRERLHHTIRRPAAFQPH
jgi:hypothetical protein